MKYAFLLSLLCVASCSLKGMENEDRELLVNHLKEEVRALEEQLKKIQEQEKLALDADTQAQARLKAPIYLATVFSTNNDAKSFFEHYSKNSSASHKAYLDGKAVRFECNEKNIIMDPRNTKNNTVMMIYISELVANIDKAKAKNAQSSWSYKTWLKAGVATALTVGGCWFAYKKYFALR